MKHLLAFLVFLLLPGMSWGASSATGTLTLFQNKNGGEYRIAWTADTDGSFDTWSVPAADIAEIKGMFIVSVVTDPGTTAPTASYDIALLGPDGEDVCGNMLADRSATATEEETCYVGSAFSMPVITSSLSMSLSNNSANSATGETVLKLSR